MIKSLSRKPARAFGLAPATALALLLGCLPGAASRAAAGQAGDFDYYVMALSWSPSWCENEVSQGETPEQCDPKRDIGFVLHGLWPQFEEGGYPEYCDTRARDPSRGQSRAMADVMGSAGLAWYQWKKHGRCSGLSGTAYYDTARRAFEVIAPPTFTQGPMKPAAIEEAFLAANPWLRTDDVIVTCSGGALREVRICLGTDLEPVACGADVLADACRADAP